MNTNKRKTVLATMVGLFAAGGMSATVAQEQVGESARAQNVLDEIIVTAEKREASLQEVPIAITAFSGDRLNDSGITETQDLVMVTPGMSFSSTGGMGRVFIRGVGSVLLQGPGVDPSTGVYLDGVYQSRFTSAVVDLMDVDRVEILKGPQGTLYGRNSNAGAVKIISKGPADEAGGGVSLELGDYGLSKLKAHLDMPIIEDELLLRVAMVKTERDGYTKDILNGFEDDFDDLIASRFVLKYLPREDLEITLRGTAINDDGTWSARKHYIDPNGLYGGQEIIADPRKVQWDFGPKETPVRARSADLSIVWDLGEMSFTSITGYTNRDDGPWQLDFEATELSGLNQGQTVGDGEGYFSTVETFSQEMVLSSQSDKPLTWLIGLYYIDDNPTLRTGIGVPQFGLPFGQTFMETQVNAHALFGSLSYDLTEKLRLNAGVRYSYEKKEVSRSRFLDFSLVRGPEFQEKDWTDVSPKLGLDYFINDDLMVYFSVTEGFKSGAFNTDGFDETPADPEYTTAYEVGLKSTSADGRLRVNLAGFQYDYKDLQVQTLTDEQNDGGTLVSVFTNAANSTIKGVEIEASALPLDNLKIDLGLAWLDAKYDEYISILGNQPADVSGNTLPQSPKFTANLGLEYTFSAPSLSGDFQFRTDFFHSGEKFFSEFNAPNSVQGSYNLINARFSYLSTDGAWELAAYGKNLSDQLVITNSLTFSLLGDGFLAELAPPRTYGVSIGYNF